MDIDEYGPGGVAQPIESFSLSTTPAAILAMLYVLLCALAVCKDLLPRLYRWKRQKSYKPRLMVLFALIALSTGSKKRSTTPRDGIEEAYTNRGSVRAIYFFTIAIGGNWNLEHATIALYTMWWFPETVLLINYITVVYFWYEPGGKAPI